jgi:hypothetical protein
VCIVPNKFMDLRLYASTAKLVLLEFDQLYFASKEQLKKRERSFLKVNSKLSHSLAWIFTCIVDD